MCKRRGVSKSMFTCFLTEDRIYDYAVKPAAGTDYMKDY